MSSIVITREIDIKRTARVLQLEGMFDVPPSKRSHEKWTVNLDLPEEWNIGLIVGPSGCGKTTIAKEIYGANLCHGFDWPQDKSILDGFPAGISIREIIDLLSSVGFSSPPSWVKPFHVLSNGEQFRVTIARALAETNDLAVIDEFTSVVDRTVAQIGSAAVQKSVRRLNKKFIAVSCHYDIVDWLEPDWVYQPHTNTLSLGRSLHQRPAIKLEVSRVHSSAWQLFRKHHYLNSNLHIAARCFCAFIDKNPVAFTAVMQFPHPKIKNAKRGHRTVCLPDYQGVGIGTKLSTYIACIAKSLGYRYISTTGHPIMAKFRIKSKDWKLKRHGIVSIMPKKLDSINKLNKTAGFDRNTYGFEYIGPVISKDEALRVWDGK